jgi:hypothetical protein
MYVYMTHIRAYTSVDILQHMFNKTYIYCYAGSLMKICKTCRTSEIFQNTYLCCLFPVKKSREGGREGGREGKESVSRGGAVRMGGVLLGVLMEIVAGPLGRSQGSPKDKREGDRERERERERGSSGGCTRRRCRSRASDMGSGGGGVVV